jgi:carbamoyl-phosphate synthase small subunit
VNERRDAILVLECGRAFRGTAFGASVESCGEVVFNTSLTGYQEILTDPSYAGQIIVMTAPQIGNTGVNRDDVEAERIACAGMVVREASPLISNWRAYDSLDRYLAYHGVGGIEGVDTRALTRVLRETGAQRGVITTAAEYVGEGEAGIASLRERVLAMPSMEGLDLVPSVTCDEAYSFDQPSWTPGDLEARPAPPIDCHIVAYDFGIKRSILHELRDLGVGVKVVPATTPADEVLALDVDGYFLSNGPGDPAAVTYAIATARALVDSGRPLFGICLGHQILALALGARTYKLQFGHHGGNHPVADLATKKVDITAQNHGFAVDADSLPATAECTHINLYDQTVEGIRLRDRPVFGLQYHPEASPGPHDAHPAFAAFAATLRAGRG